VGAGELAAVGNPVAVRVDLARTALMWGYFTAAFRLRTPLRAGRANLLAVNVQWQTLKFI